jgi:hypothetical protein
MAAAVEVDAAEGAGALERHGAHLEVAAADLSVE